MVRKSAELDSADEQTHAARISKIWSLADYIRRGITVPDFRLARYTASRRKRHMKLLWHLLRYLKFTILHAIFFTGWDSSSMKWFSNANNAECHDRKSTSASLRIIFGASVRCYSGKQQSVAFSTCEANYVVASMALKEVLWFPGLIHRTSLKQKKTTKRVHIDKRSAMDIPKNSCNFKYRKAIDVHNYHLIYYIYQKHVIITHFDSLSNVKDSSMEQLKPTTYRYIHSKISVTAVVTTHTSLELYGVRFSTDKNTLECLKPKCIAAEAREASTDRQRILCEQAAQYKESQKDLSRRVGKRVVKSRKVQRVSERLLPHCGMWLIPSR